MDITMFTTGYTALKSIKEIGGGLLQAKIDSDSKQKVSEVLDKLGTVQDTLFFIREELLKLQDDKQTLKKTISELEEKLSVKEKLIYEKPSYWMQENDNRIGPFCQRCYDAEQKLIRLQGGKNDFWKCMQCDSTFYGPDYTPPSPRRIRSSTDWMGY
jgi:ribosomal protein L37AE/L43A